MRVDKLTKSDFGCPQLETDLPPPKMSPDAFDEEIDTSQEPDIYLGSTKKFNHIGANFLTIAQQSPLIKNHH
jgi:hypothetical protein